MLFVANQEANRVYPSGMKTFVVLLALLGIALSHVHQMRLHKRVRKENIHEITHRPPPPLDDTLDEVSP